MGIQTIKSIFFGSVFRILGTFVLALVVTVGGAFAAGVIGIPGLESVDNEFGEVDDEHTEILTDMTIHNPNPVGAGSADVDAEFVVSMNGIEMADGGGEDITLEPGTSTESFRTQMRNDRIPEWWVTHIENDEQTHVEIDATVSSGVLDRSTRITDEQTVETDLLSAFNSDETRPVNAERPVVDDPFLYVNRTRGQWGGVDQRHTELELEFDIYNPQSYAVPMTELGYEITMNDVVIGEGESNREYVLQPGRETTVETVTRIENDNLDDWWVTHVENEEVSELRIEFVATFELASGTTITIPLESLTYEETVETDIWGNEEDDSADDETSASSDEDGSASSDDETRTDDGTDQEGNDTDETGDDDTDDDDSDDSGTGDDGGDEDDTGDDDGGDEDEDEDDDGFPLTL
ncbi:LEA type 2 family protein [Natronosalvus vescus]|uniref:LEA type 2 family protein n=1 Tax=Natronosalvus vescus TaxID=2953881 RepID=UPI00209136C8|nr:LEA type 2 family protein [Natronosalvus vescus]